MVSINPGCCLTRFRFGIDERSVPHNNNIHHDMIMGRCLSDLMPSTSGIVPYSSFDLMICWMAYVQHHHVGTP